MSEYPIINCPLCGYEFERSDAVWACRQCALARDCRLLRCPACHYEWPADSRIVTWLQQRGLIGKEPPQA